MFAGYANLDTQMDGLLVVPPPGGGPPAAPVAAPTWQVYDASGPIPNATGTCVKFQSDPGLYSYSIPVPGSGGFEVAGSYRVVFRYAIGQAQWLDWQQFLVT